MTVIFINKDVADLRVEIRWDGNNKTEAFAIEKGGFGGLDIDKSEGIPLGSKCWVFAWKEGTDLAYCPDKKFHYLDVRGAVATYEFSNEQFSKPAQLTNLRAA